VAYFEHATGGTDLAEYAGLGRRHPWAAAALAVFLFSLAGIPPTGGFLAKFYLFRAALAQQPPLLYLTIFGVLASLISAYYYLRIIVALYMEQSQPTGRAVPVSPSAAITVAGALCLILVLTLGVYPSPVLAAARSSIAALF